MLNTSKTKPFIPWMGWMRVIAMLLVCLCHAGDPLAAFGAPSDRIWSEIFGSFIRPCVPLFVMLTGMLILPKHETFEVIFKKRIVRLLWPFLTWTLVYSALPWLLHLCGITEETMQRVIFPWAAPIHTDGGSILRTFFLSIFQFNQYAVQLWYIYLLIGLYLIMPILSAWLKEATTKAKLIFLSLWGISMLIWYWPLLLEALLQTSFGSYLLGDYVVRFLHGATHFDLAKTTDLTVFQLLGACNWNSYNGVYYFSGFIGYLVLGNVLSTVKLSLKKTLLISIPLFVVGYCIVYFGTHWMWNRPDCTDLMLEFFWWYCSIPVAMMTIAMFLTIKHFSWAPAPVEKLLRHYTKCGFGVFCAHYVFVTGIYYLISDYLPTPLLLPTVALSSFLVSWLFIALLERIPGTHRFLG